MTNDEQIDGLAKLAADLIRDLKFVLSYADILDDGWQWALKRYQARIDKLTESAE